VSLQMSRRGFIRAGAATAAGASLLPASGCSPLRDGGESGDTNVLLLIIDSLRPDYVGCYGSPRVQTPTIDALAARGLRFTRAFPEAMVTVPARRSMFTGRRIFPFHDWKLHPGLGRSPGWAPIDDLDTVFTTEMGKRGYWTTHVTDNPHIGFSSWYHDYRLSFDRFLSVEGTAGEVRPPESVPMRQVLQWVPEGLRDERFIPGMQRYLANNGLTEDGDFDEEQTSPARLFKNAMDLLEEAAGKAPFAMVIDCFDPHEPWSPPRKYIELYGDPDYRGPEVGSVRYSRSDYLTEDELRRARAVYSASVTLVDHWLGRFMERLRELDLERNTAIVLLSDHGLLLGDRGWTGKIPAELHPEMAQIPFIIVHPDNKAAGVTSPYFASTHDVAPTLLSLAGLDLPGHIEGTDLSPLLDGDAPAEARPFQYGGYFNRFYVRTDDWALFGDNQGNERELYDLTLDRYERHNVVQRHGRRSDDFFELVKETTGGPLPLYLLPDRSEDPDPGSDPISIPVAPG